MTLPPFLKNLAWDQWLYGLISSVISAGSTAASGVTAAMVIAPDKFNFSQLGNLFKLSCAIFLFGAVPQFWAYLKQGLPPMLASKKESEQTITRPDGGTVKTKTSSEVVVQQPSDESKK